MEAGAIKASFNKEVILLKKKLDQSKLQTIRKLTRKAKTFREKKCPEALKQKLERKADAFINEVLIIKKIKVKDIAKFALTHTRDLKKYLDQPEVNHDKACARLLLHNSLQDKYTFLRNTFSALPIKDLFMSREERRKLKKEERKKKLKKKEKKRNAVDKGIEDNENNDDKEMKMITEKNEIDTIHSTRDNQSISDDDGIEGIELSSSHEHKSNSDDEIDSIQMSPSHEEPSTTDDDDTIENIQMSPTHKVESTSDNEIVQMASTYQIKSINDNVQHDQHDQISSLEMKNTYKIPTSKTASKINNIKKKSIDVSKNLIKKQKFSEKIQNKKLKKVKDAKPVAETVDPFFVTSTNDSYVSLNELRKADQVKKEHKKGNRKLRRAIQFGYVPEPKYERRKNNNDVNKKFNTRSMEKNDYRLSNRIIEESPKVEKLHPSWEAKKKMSGILPFQGKKVVFDGTD